MRTRFFNSAFWCIFISVLFFYSCSEKNNKKVKVSGNKIKVNIETFMLEINIEEENIINFRYYPFSSNPKFESYSCIQRNKSEISYNWRVKGDALLISTALIETEINLVSGSVRILDKAKKLLFSETEMESKILTPLIAENDTGFSIAHNFHLQKNEAIYGFGQHQEGVMNYRGKSVELFQHNMKVALPIMISSLGYGVFWDNYSFSKFNDKKTASFWSEMGDGLNFYFIYGPEVDNIISSYRTLTGKAPMLPKWAFGLIHSRAKYDNQNEILDVVKRYRDLKVPLDVIVQDWQYWPNGWWGFKEYDPTRFPDPEKMIKDIHEKYNCHYMISIWPCLQSGSRDYFQMDSSGFLFPGVDERRYYNAFNADARKLYWEQANNGLFKYGVDAWWCDATEPEINGWDTNIEDYKRLMKPTIGSSTRYLNAYSLFQSEAIYQGQRSETSDKRVMNLTRSAFAGQQRYGTITWSGDVSADWVTFYNQISAGLNFSVSGLPYWTTDIGAFFVNDIDWFRTGIFPEGVKDPAYHEFFIRWYQFGAFSPLFRVHGAQTPREIWNFGNPGDKAFDIQLKYNNLRYRLLPYIYSLVGKVTLDNYTIMRPLVMDFRQDTASLNISNQFMFGPAFLVNPVTEPNAITRKVYLPDNEGGWFDFWTGKHFEGNKKIETYAAIETIPLFIRAGSIIPMGPFLQYSGEKIADPLEIRIYGGQDGEFTLYEDEGDNYNYEVGKYSTITFKWSDRDKILEVSDSKGSYPNKPENRIFKIVKVDESNGNGLEIANKIDRIIEYSGKSLRVEL